MKREWVKGTLGAVCEIQSGAGFPDKLQGQVGQKFPFYKVSDMNLPGNEIFMVSENNSVSDAVRQQLRARIFPKGSVIFPKVGGAIATNKKRRVLKDCCVDNNVMGLVPRPEYIDANYLFYFMQKINIYEFSNKAALPSIRQSTVETWEINYPKSLTEQKRIVAILDEAFEGIDRAIANTEKNLANAREVFESYLNAALSRADGWVERRIDDAVRAGWHGRPLGECIERVKYDSKIPKSEFLETGSYPIVSQEADFVNGFWDKSTDLFKVERPVVVFGDHTLVLKYIDFDFVIGADGVKVLKPKPFLYPKYFYYFLRSVRLKRLGYARHYRLLANIDVIYPSLSEQERIVAKLDAISAAAHRLEAFHQRKLVALEELKQAVLQQAFAGQLTARSVENLQEAAQ